MSNNFSLSSYIHMHKFISQNPYFESNYDAYFSGVDDWENFVELPLYLRKELLIKIGEKNSLEKIKQNLVNNNINILHYANVFYARKSGSKVKIKVEVGHVKNNNVYLKLAHEQINPVNVTLVSDNNNIVVNIYEFIFEPFNSEFQFYCDNAKLEVNYAANSFKMNVFSNIMFVEEWAFNYKLNTVEKINNSAIYLLKKSKISLFKFVILYATQFFKKHKKRKIIIVSDRVDRGFDNGDYFAEYLYGKKRKDVKVYYAIGKNAPNFKEYKHKYNVLVPGSFKYIFHQTVADVIISSQLSPWIRYPVRNKRPVVLSRVVRDYKVVFLQHGTIINKDLAKTYNYTNSTVDVFVSSNEIEYKLLQSPPFTFGNKVILTGMPRHEKLSTYKKKKQILFIPTWRKEYVFYKNDFEYEFHAKFYDTKYFTNLVDLVNNKQLEKLLMETEYELKIFMHPCFKNMNFPEVSIANTQYINDSSKNLTEYIGESSIFITDFSSIKHDAKISGANVVIFDINDDLPIHLEMEKRFTINKTINALVEDIDKNIKLRASKTQTQKVIVNDKIYQKIEELLNND